ncbi:MAG TPA: hypothetical protein DD379_17800 [Cyanobacteria bacterium UBA11162]|nr:hypothetical protein [Cyanobacteria bacterium UBA11162]
MTKLVIFRPVGDLETQGYSVHLVIQDVGDATQTLLDITGCLPPNPELASHLRLHWLQNYRLLGVPSRKLELESVEIDYEGSIQQRIKECQVSANGLCDRLKRWFDSPEFYHLNLQLREKLNPDDSIQFLLRTEDSQLLKLPWQTWDFFEHYPLAEFARIPLQCHPTNRLLKSYHKSSIKILAILGHSYGIDVEVDRRMLENLPHAEITFLVEKTHQEINDQLWDKSWDIIFFAGHSETVGETGRIYINPTDYLTVNELWFALKKAVERGLNLAIFNSCDGLGLAQQLDDLHIPQMIVMRELVPDRVAQAFLKYFLTAFSQGQPFHLAVREARERLQGMESEFPCASWLPLICQNLVAESLSWNELAGIRVSTSQTNRTLVPNINTIGLNPWFKLTAILGLSCLISYILLGSRIAPWVNELGLKNYHDGKLLNAEFYYRLATFLDFNYANPHYNLGYLWDKDRNDLARALENYQRAALRGLPEGYAQVARLSILNNNHSAALSAIYQCLELTPYEAVKAACLKNLGWVLLKDGNLIEAEKNLRRAIELEPDSPHSHCLLAQVLEATGRQQEARNAWKNTLNYSQHRIPEQHNCIGWATQRLQTGKNLP